MWNIASDRVTQFSYFDRLLEGPVWKGRKILDFGGNVGGFLVSAGNRVEHDDYWCLDLNEDVIARGRRNFPGAHFHRYNRYSPQYNSNGIRNLPIPDLGLKFDIILAFSVFTHTHRNEMLELVEQLKSKLGHQGILAFTFCDPSYDRSLSDPRLPSGTDVRKNLEWQKAVHPSLEIEDMVARARQANWCVLIDDKLYVEPESYLSNQEHRGRPLENYCAYFSVDYMATLFPEANISPPITPEWQHCCVLRKT